LRPARSGSPPPSRRARWRGRCGNRSRSGRYWCRSIWALSSSRITHSSRVCGGGASDRTALPLMLKAVRSS
jgi:hypothetical protein